MRTHTHLTQCTTVLHGTINKELFCKDHITQYAPNFQNRESYT